MAIINPEQVVFVIDGKQKGTSVIGIESWNEEKKKMVIDQQIVSKNEGLELGKMLKKKQAAQAKLAKAAGQPAPRKEEYSPRLLRAHNGQPVSLDQIMSVQKRGK